MIRRALEFLPADDRFFEQDFVNGTQIDAAAGQLAELFDVVRDPAANAAEREGRTDDDRKPELLDRRKGIFHVADVTALRHIGADLAHRVAELQSIFREIDRVDRRANQLDVVLLQCALLCQRDGQVQRRLTADGWKHRIGTLAFDDLLEDLRRQWLDVGPIRDLRIGHDRRRVAVDENDFEAFGAKRLARLRARIVELAGLADDDRA